MKDNRGFTLIEFIVVVLIIAVLSTGTILSANVLGLGSAKSTVERISTLLDYVQVENMTKNKPYFLIIEENSDKYYARVYKDTEVISSEKLELTRGELSCLIDTGIVSTEYLISSTSVAGRDTISRLRICFFKETGGINEYDGSHAVEQITVSAAGSTYSIRLVAATGKHYIE